jgi:hypothetical protein
MASSSAKTVEAYLAELPPDRRGVISAVRDVVCRNLPKGYREVMNWGMISYEIPLERYPNTYNGEPLMYAALAAQKNHYALYLMGLYSDGPETGWFREEFASAGKKLDMGKSCVRFKKLADLPLDTIAKAIALMSPEKFIELFEASRGK